MKIKTILVVDNAQLSGYKFGWHALARNPRLDNELMFLSFVLILPNGITVVSVI